MMFKKHALVAATLALAALSAQAHDLWFKPSSTVLSKSDWVTVDAAVSNDVFFFNHRPLGLENVKITGPDGSAVEMKNAHKGELRSVFDFKPEKPGTYRVTMLMNGVMGSYKDANGQPKRVRGSADEIVKQIPADAKDVNITENVRRMETFVSVGSAITRGAAVRRSAPSAPRPPRRRAPSPCRSAVRALPSSRTRASSSTTPVSPSRPSSPAPARPKCLPCHAPAAASASPRSAAGWR